VVLALFAHIIIIMFLFEQEKRIEARNEASLSQKKKNFFFFRAKKGIEARLHIFLLFFFLLSDHTSHAH
jgi:hypothetical protein